MPKFEPSPPALIERFDAVVARRADVERRKMFGYPALFVGGNLVSGLFADGWMLRLGPDDPSSISDSSVGYRAFGGTEITFPSVPRMAFSVDVGYLHADAPFPGFDDGGMRVSISGHWYVK